MSIRKIARDDMGEVITLLQDISDYTPHPDLLGEIWEQYSAQPNLYAIVAVKDSAVIGYGAILIETKIRGGKMGHIEDIVTHSDHRSQGIGRLIIEALIGYAREQGCYKSVLQCKEKNAAFYEKLGGQINGVAMQYFTGQV